MMDEFHEANMKSWDAVSPHWQAGIDAKGVWRRAHKEPDLGLDPRERAHLGDIEGKAVCVLGSGDNVVVFALAGLGARVTSVDISQSQLDIAAGRAADLGLSVSFIRADVTDLSQISDASFDIVYTGGHVAVWVSDLRSYYSEAVRILKPGRLFVVNEYHPIRRIWQDGADRLELAFSYLDRGPHRYDRSAQVPGAKPGSLPSYEFAWTVADYVSAVVDAGCDLVAIDEFGDQAEGWEEAPMAGLPNCLLVVGRKRA